MSEPTKKWTKGKISIAMWDNPKYGKSFAFNEEYEKKDGSRAFTSFISESNMLDLKELLFNIFEDIKLNRVEVEAVKSNDSEDVLEAIKKLLNSSK